MTDDSILKKVLSNLGQIVAETGQEAAKEVGKVTESIITGKELLGDIKPLSDHEVAQKKADDERKKQKEMNELRAAMGQGRNVEGEVEQVRKEEEREEDQKEREFLENLRRQREAEEAERQQLGGGGESSNPAKRKKSRGSAFAGGKKKSHQPDPAAMSQTNEQTGGKID